MASFVPARCLARSTMPEDGQKGTIAHKATSHTRRGSVGSLGNSISPTNINMSLQLCKQHVAGMAVILNEVLVGIDSKMPTTGPSQASSRQRLLPRATLPSLTSHVMQFPRLPSERKLILIPSFRFRWHSAPPAAEPSLDLSVCPSFVLSSSVFHLPW